MTSRRVQIGEVCGVVIPRARVTQLRTRDGLTTVAVEVSHAGEVVRGYDIPLDSGIELTPREPADGVPKPGEVWTDQTGTIYFAIFEAGRLWLAAAVSKTGMRYSWEELHADPDGPIYRLWRPEPAALTEQVPPTAGGEQ